MNTIKTKIVELPTFEQLTTEEKLKVIEKYYGINVDYSDWYSSIKDDAWSVYITIDSFNLDCNFISISLHDSAEETATSILEIHGENCETYQIAKTFLEETKNLEYNSNDYELKHHQFVNDIGKEYLKMLQADFDYLTSENAITETLISNEYTFNRETLEIDN